MEILGKIKKDLEEVFGLSQIESLDAFSRHFVVGRFVRDKYLWKNPDVVKKLNAFFGTKNVDDLSAAILKFVIQSSKPSK